MEREELLEEVLGDDEDCFDINIGMYYIYGINWNDESNADFAPPEEQQAQVEALDKSGLYSPLQIVQLQVGIYEGLDIEPYSNPELTAQEMRELRLQQTKRQKTKQL